MPVPPRSRAPLVVGALLAVLIAGGLAVMFTRGGNDDESVTDATEESAPDSTPATDESSPDTTSPVTEPAPSTTGPTLTLPVTVAPVTTVPVAPTLPAPGIPIPPGAVLATDPAGWTMAVDPAWNETDSGGVRSWFIEPGATTGDNVNVTTEALPGGVNLDAYVAAAIENIQTAAPDFEIVFQRRDIGVDGVEVELIGWTGTIPGLPKLSFLQAVTVSPSAAYIATFTSQPESMPTMAPFLEPFLVTLRGA